MSIQIYPSKDVSFADTGINEFFAKNVQTSQNLEFVVNLHFEWENLPPDSKSRMFWDRMRVSPQDQEKLEFFAHTTNQLFRIIDRIVEIEQNGGILKQFGRERANLYKQYDQVCKNASGEWITVHGRWGD